MSEASLTPEACPCSLDKDSAFLSSRAGRKAVHPQQAAGAAGLAAVVNAEVARGPNPFAAMLHVSFAGSEAQA